MLKNEHFWWTNFRRLIFFRNLRKLEHFFGLCVANLLRAFLQIRNAAQIVERKIDDFGGGKIDRFVQAR